MSLSFVLLMSLLAGAGLIAIPLANILRSLRIARWPTTSGTVIRSTVIASTDPERGSWPDVQYEYWIAGVRHVGQRVRAQANSALAIGGDAQEVCRQYPVGTAVPVFVNPANPSDCALEARVGPRSVAILLGYGSFTVAIACYALVRASS